jgi:hypothetical protein
VGVGRGGVEGWGGGGVEKGPFGKGRVRADMELECRGCCNIGAPSGQRRTPKDLQVDGLLEPGGQLLLIGTGQQRAHKDAEVVACGHAQITTTGGHVR